MPSLAGLPWERDAPHDDEVDDPEQADDGELRGSGLRDAPGGQADPDEGERPVPPDDALAEPAGGGGGADRRLPRHDPAAGVVPQAEDLRPPDRDGDRPGCEGPPGVVPQGVQDRADDDGGDEQD